MNSMLWAVLTVALAFQLNSCTCADAVPSQQKDVSSSLEEGMMAVYTLANGFLEDVVQRNYLTEYVETYQLDTIDKYKESWESEWDSWLLFYVGFVVCLSIGVVLTLTMLLACFIFPCCRCCGKCGGADLEGDPPPSRCCTIGCSVSLVLVLIALLLGAIPMFLTAGHLADQLAGPVFTDVASTIDGTESYLKSSVDEVNNTICGSYVETETEVFKILDGIPEGAIKAIDDETQAVTTLNDLNRFASNLTDLQAYLMDSQSLANSLTIETDRLNEELNATKARILADPAFFPCSTGECEAVKIHVENLEVRVNFSVVDLLNASIATNASIAGNFAQLVSDAVHQVDQIQSDIETTIAPSVNDIKDQSTRAKSKMYGEIENIDEQVEGIDFKGLHDDVMKIPEDDWYEIGYSVLYGVMLGMASLVVLVICLALVGLVLGLCLSRRNANLDECRPNKSWGSCLLMTSVGLVLVFYWLFTLFLAALFISGGISHTEVCRHLVNYENPKSFEVLSVFEGWINETISFDVDILPFSTYRSCASNVSAYKALNLEQNWNATAIAAKMTSMIQRETEEIKTTPISVPQVNIADPQLISLLEMLDSAFGSSGLDFNYFYANIQGSITDPDLNQLASELDNLSDFDLSNHSAELRSIYTRSVVPIEQDRDRLMIDLQAVESIVSTVSFSTAADVLVSSNDTINVNGTVIVSAYVNDTADSIYNEVVTSIDTVSYQIQNEVARCRPLYDSYTTSIDAACLRLLYPVNGFWFSLGSCIFFLIPFLFLAVNLASNFR